ncbi:hypothetical protein Ahy_A02g006006 isoform A [Arachis hypogaea]|uniref:Uncharacterized protein n=2 Tax=Arachis hypogaea TaxID=3818 RepID=A0A445E8D8_ARAHY|nr:hypothetical protein Ahy_A02g006006 isoform A [Arachis hypogaea]
MEEESCVSIFVNGSSISIEPEEPKKRKEKGNDAVMKGPKLWQWRLKMGKKREEKGVRVPGLHSSSAGTTPQNLVEWAILCWCVWKARNRFIFDQESSLPEQILEISRKLTNELHPNP